MRQSLATRTQLTLRYNQGLAEGAARRGLPFIDIADAIIKLTSGVVADRFRHPDPTDHHLDPEKAGPLGPSASTPRAAIGIEVRCDHRGIGRACRPPPAGLSPRPQWVR